MVLVIVLIMLERYIVAFKQQSGLSATFEVGAASVRVGDELNYFLVSVPSKMC